VTATAPAPVSVITQRCNIYGHETGGPKHLLGGLYGPEYEGQHKWVCENPAVLRARMMCAKGHKGQIMNLCREHAIECQKRQSDLCPPCAYPPAAVELEQAMNFVQMEISALIQAGQGSGLLLVGGGAVVRMKEMDALTRQLNGYRDRMTELNMSGVIQKNPLTLTEIS
jgi:hypothetical protein